MTDIDQPSAADLPVGSVVAANNKAWIKKSRPDGPRSVETYWIATETYAIPAADRAIDRALDNGAMVLRVGDGEDRP
jgi:hypothetical protein